MKERKAWKGKKYRRLYRYKCTSCGMKRTTLQFERKENGTCTNCVPIVPLKDQTNIFDSIAESNPQGGVDLT